MSAFLQIGQLNKVYHSQREPLYALKDVSLDIEEGEFVSIVGPSGCGKSTLLKCVAGLEPISSGHLALQGDPIVGPPANMGVVFQRDLLLDWRTILDNVLIAAEFHDLDRADFEERARSVLNLFGLGAFAHRYPWELSGGMRQRASICRALLVDPQLLLMDEPFGALDALTRAYLQQELHRIWQAEGITMILVTHDVEEAIYLGDRVVVMEPRPGRIRRILPVPLAHPRDRAALGFARVKDDVLQEFTGRLADLAEAPIKRDAAAQYTDRLPPKCGPLACANSCCRRPPRS
ncbi:ABC transporter [Cupriavidus basilensis OR16]|uniref:ABC transporter n=1 Tax=Cupriavidus basilensis OR16 TaxID=1127483 RepID=H1S983_9BURK|nr:ATP-binding cassette domain-containing protein [Cupriavidus basilensis]EHP40933.1 ABC transporter [Cupriavidus basilensis OR16]